MQKNSQPPHFREKKRFYEGILHPKEFEKNYVLRCYEPLEAMAPFVEHYFISRRRPDFDPSYIGHDVLSQPVVSLFIRPEEAFFQGPTTGKRTLYSKEMSIYAGAQFKPGGFYPFWGKKVAELAEKTIPAMHIIPEANQAFRQIFGMQNDADILTVIDHTLRLKQPQYARDVDFINQIISYIEAHSSSANVASVARHFGVSERSLQQLFQVHVGVGVKWTIMRARFLEVTKRARDTKDPDWVAIASEFGYSDQPHFIHDFKKLVGLPPQQYVTLLG